ncbi:MAG TPA: DNA internalization-related competence protein ComEC/Rec2 [Gemmatimonadaceae bacterium]|jgi:competence protein ComEC|nr:DNA internalization-related competence protein ComEC/Rec2 [Gemmatimonadaceae bacterium]
MPLIAWAVAAFVAGAYAGFAANDPLELLLFAAATLICVRHGPLVVGGMVMACLAGDLAARASASIDRQCLAAAASSGIATGILEGDASPGSFSHIRLDACGATIALSTNEGDAPDGSTVLARGQPARTTRGLALHGATIRTIRAPPFLPRARAAAGRAIDRTFGADAPLVRALVIADKHELSPEVRDRFAAAGLAHILAIAGLHIGIIAATLRALLDLTGTTRQRSNLVIIVAIITYVTVIGAPVPAVRSATMLSVFLLTRLIQRPTTPWAVVALGAAHAVLDPRVVLDVGYQLSVVGVSSMIAADIFAQRFELFRLGPVREAAVLTLIGTTVATIGSAPLVALAFGRVSVIAPLSNLAATPLIALAQPTILLGLALSPIPPLAHFVADAAHPLLAGLNAVASTSAAIPGASIGVAPGIAASVVAGVMSCATIVACASEKEWLRPATVAVAAAGVLVWLPLVPERAGMFEVHMIDVGQGDAIALRTPHGHWVVIDAGGAWRGGDAGHSTVVPYIGLHGGVVDEFILSHPHTDHVGGADAVLRVLHPRTYVDAGFPGPAESYRTSLATAAALGVRWSRAHPGDSTVIDGVTLHILAPDSSWTSHLVDPNLASVIVLARYGHVRVLLMGDAERPEEDWLLAHVGEGALASEALDADVLKVGHHGSGTSSSEAFIEAVRPRVALVSVGAGNRYHLPTPAVMRRLAAYGPHGPGEGGAGAQVLRTDRLGTIVVRTDGEKIFVAAAGDAWELPPRSSDSSDSSYSSASSRSNRCNPECTR